MRKAVYGQGLNFMGQLALNNKYTNAPSFSRVESLDNREIVSMDCGLTSSFALLKDSQILHWGWILDNLTSVRTLSFYKHTPIWSKIWQKYSLFGNTLGMRSGIEYPSLLNKNIMQQESMVKMAIGGSFILALTKQGHVYGLGENYKGQLGLGDTTYRSKFERILLPTQEKVIDIRAGFQHSILLTGNLFIFNILRRVEYIVVEGSIMGSLVLSKKQWLIFILL